MPSTFLTTTVINRAEALLEKMTLSQKIGQMTQVERSTCSPEEVRQFHIGSVLSGAGSTPGDNEIGDWLNMIDDYWRASTFEKVGFLNIPILYGVDAVHGHGNLKNATIFPHQIGLGAAPCKKMVFDIAQATAKELRATGVNWVFGPNLAVAKNIRWGRTYESFSENTDVVTQLTTELVHGFQSKNLNNTDSVMACAKHFVGDGGTKHGIDQGDTIISEMQLMDHHVKPYIEAINANVLSVMVSFSSWNGVKCHANKTLITDLLKAQLGFDGFVLSDMEGIDYLSHDFYQAVAQGVNAGIDMFMMPNNWSLFIEYMHHHVEFGTIPMARIDDAVRRILSAKLAAGLFESSLPSNHPIVSQHIVGCRAHRQLAQKAVQRSLVKLKDPDHLLPLSPKCRVLVSGKNADNVGHQCGGFTVEWQGVSGNDAIIGATSIFQGIAALNPNAKILSQEQIRGDLANEFDFAIAVIGEKPYAEGLGDIRGTKDTAVNCVTLEEGQFNVMAPYGHSLNLAELHPEDLAVIKALKQAGLPVITVMISGRPLNTDQELLHSDAFVAAWLPGSEGQGVADVLFGEVDFVGQLNFSWPSELTK